MPSSSYSLVLLNTAYKSALTLTRSGSLLCIWRTPPAHVVHPFLGWTWGPWRDTAGYNHTVWCEMRRQRTPLMATLFQWKKSKGTLIFLAAMSQWDSHWAYGQLIAFWPQGRSSFPITLFLQSSINQLCPNYSVHRDFVYICFSKDFTLLILEPKIILLFGITHFHLKS